MMEFSCKVRSLVFPYLKWDDLLTCHLVSKCWDVQARQQLLSPNIEQPMLKFGFCVRSQSYVAQFEDEDDGIMIKRSRPLLKLMECFSTTISTSSSSSSRKNDNLFPYKSFGFFGGDWDTEDLRQFWVQFGSNVKTLELGVDDTTCALHSPTMSTLHDILSKGVPNLSHLILDLPPTHWENVSVPSHHYGEGSLPCLTTMEIEEYQSYKEHTHLIMALVGGAPNLKNFVNFQFSLLDPFIQGNKIGLIKNLEVTHPTYLSEHTWNLGNYFRTWKRFLDHGGHGHGHGQQPSSLLKVEKILVIPDESFYCDNERVKTEFVKMLQIILQNCQHTLKELAMYPVPGVFDDEEGSLPVLSKLKTLKLYEFDLCIKGRVGQNILVKGSRLAKLMPNLYKVELFATDYYDHYEHEDGQRFFMPFSQMRPTSGGSPHGPHYFPPVFTIDSSSESFEGKKVVSHSEEKGGFFPTCVKRLELTLTLMESMENPVKMYQIPSLLLNLSRLFVNVDSLRVRSSSLTDPLSETLKAVCVGWKNLISLEVGALQFDVGTRIPGKKWKSKKVFDDDNHLAQPIDLNRLRREWPLSSLKNLRSLDIKCAESDWENCPGFRFMGPHNFLIGQATDLLPGGKTKTVLSNDGDLYGLDAGYDLGVLFRHLGSYF